MAKIMSSNSKGYILLDDEDLEKVLSITKNWSISSNGYACGYNNKTNISMHRLILDAPKGLYVDHKNHIRHDNRKCNIRLCTSTENNRNYLKQRQCLSKYKGIDRLPTGKYRARIYPDGKSIHLGTFITEEEAAYAYNIASKEYYGEFACLNNVTKQKLNPINPRNNITNMKYVYPTRNKFKVCKWENKKLYDLGHRDTLEEAIKLRDSIFG